MRSQRDAEHRHENDSSAESIVLQTFSEGGPLIGGRRGKRGWCNQLVSLGRKVISARSTSPATRTFIRPTVLDTFPATLRISSSFSTQPSLLSTLVFLRECAHQYHRRFVEVKSVARSLFVIFVRQKFYCDS